MGRLDWASWIGLAAAGAVAGACNTFDEPSEVEDGEGRLVIPVDERAAVQGDGKVVPVSGGTLLALADDAVAVSDPDRDSISIVEVSPAKVRHTVALESGDEPGRLAQDAAGRVHVVLRGGGAVLSLDPVTGATIGRRSVCGAPRGIGYDATDDLIHVACAEGQLVSLPAAGGDAVRSVRLAADLRDVLVRGSELWVTRFKSGDVLRVDRAGALVTTTRLPQGSAELVQTIEDENSFTQTFRTVSTQSAVAWRAVNSAEGGAVVVHQEEVEDEVELTEPSVQGSAYGGGSGGGGFDCGGIVRNKVTYLAPDGSVLGSQRFAGAPLPVDIASARDGAWVAIAHAGLADPEAPRPFVAFPGNDAPQADRAAFAFGGGVTILPRQVSSEAQPFECTFATTVPINDPIVAVAALSNGRLVAQSREPARLWIIDQPNDPFSVEPREIPLPGESVRDTGHELFHRDSGGGIACASCHPEGGEDGHVWQFSGVGQRRTQALHVGLEGTAPFHWDGDLSGLGDLMSTVFVGRMGGARQSSERLGALQDWLFSIPRPPAMVHRDDPAAIRGKELFESRAVGCTECHTGPQLTNNVSVSVGTLPEDGKLQVPSLVAIGYRAPFMHDGCASTLAERFDPACGGEQHGNTSQLGEDEIADLVAYLESL